MSGFETTTTRAPLVECGAFNSSYLCDSSRCTWSCDKKNNCICLETATLQAAIYIGIGAVVGIAFLVFAVCMCVRRNSNNNAPHVVESRVQQRQAAPNDEPERNPWEGMEMEEEHQGQATAPDGYQEQDHGDGGQDYGDGGQDYGDE